MTSGPETAAATDAPSKTPDNRCTPERAHGRNDGTVREPFRGVAPGNVRC
jgi:hypothetical protein